MPEKSAIVFLSKVFIPLPLAGDRTDRLVEEFADVLAGKFEEDTEA